MRTILTFALAAALHAAPVTFTPSGSITETAPGIYFFDLYNSLNDTQDRTATLTASAPLASIDLFVDNYPFLVGSGVKFSLDGVEVLDTGFNTPIQQVIQLSAASFTQIGLSTTWSPGWLERGILEIRGWTVPEDQPTGEVPEPASVALMFLGFAALFGTPTITRMIRRREKRCQHGTDVSGSLKRAACMECVDEAIHGGNEGAK